MTAIRHRLRTRLLLGSSWLDVTDQLLVRNSIKIKKGRRDEATESTPMTATFTLKNDDLQWTPDNPLGPYYEDLKRNVPVVMERIQASDDFDRSSSAGWNTAPTGQTWLHFGAGGSHVVGDYTISGGMGRMSIPTTSAYRAAYLSGQSLYNAAVECTFQLPTANVTGGDLEPGNVLLRVQSIDTYYMVRVVVNTAEAVTVALYAVVSGVSTLLAGPSTVSGLTNTGQRIRVKGIVEGQTFQAKVWEENISPGSTGEPLFNNVVSHTAHIETAGSVGVRNGVGAGNTNTSPVVIGNDDFLFYSPRFRGELAKLVQADNVKGSDRHAKAQAAGILRRLGQGTSPVMSSLKRGYLGIGPDLVAYWPCEDGPDSLSIASAIGGPPMSVDGAPDFAVNDDFPCSQRLPEANESGWFGPVPEYTFNGETQLRFLVSVPLTGTPDDTILARIGCEGTATLWEVVYHDDGDGSLQVKAYNFAGVEILASGVVAFSMKGNPCRVSLELTNDGADVDWALSTVRVRDLAGGGISGTLAGRQVGRVLEVQGSPQGIFTNVAFGHFSLESNITNLFANASELRAWFGEDAVARIRRLCGENGVSFFHYEGGVQDAAFMGHQRPLKLLELLRECEATDGGVLHEPRGTFGLEYRTRRSEYTQDPRITADVSLGQVCHPFQPIVDDQRTRNDVTVEQPDGTSARAELTTGPMSVQDYPDGIGRVDTRYDVNVSDSTTLPNHAEFRLALGTVAAVRVPDIRFDLEAKEITPLLPVLLDLMLDDRVLFTNAGGRTGIYDPISQMARGVTEEWTNHRGLFSINGSPESPYAVGELDGNARLDSDSSTLSGALSASATGTFSVASGLGDLWITTATHAADFPVDIIIGGEKITISSITGSSSPQTFTIATSGRGVNGVHEPGAVGKAHPSGAEVHVYEPFRLGL